MEAYFDNSATTRCFDEVKDDTLVFFTALGNAKRTEGKEFDLRTKKTAAIALKDDDRVIAVEKQPYVRCVNI